MLVFLDSNVVFSGLYSPSGAPGILLTRFVGGEFKVVLSQDVVDEVTRNVGRLIPEALPKLQDLLVGSHPEIVDDPPPEEVAHWRRVIHTEDSAVLAAAIAAKPDYFVTGDKHFFRNPQIATKSGLRIVTPAQFVAILDRNRP